MGGGKRFIELPARQFRPGNHRQCGADLIRMVGGIRYVDGPAGHAYRILVAPVQEVAESDVHVGDDHLFSLIGWNVARAQIALEPLTGYLSNPERLVQLPLLAGHDHLVVRDLRRPKQRGAIARLR